MNESTKDWFRIVGLFGGVVLFLYVLFTNLADVASEIEIHEVDSGTKCAVTGLIVKSISCWKVENNGDNSKQAETNATTG